jgi:hypothetical protein
VSGTAAGIIIFREKAQLRREALAAGVVLVSVAHRCA